MYCCLVASLARAVVPEGRVDVEQLMHDIGPPPDAPSRLHAGEIEQVNAPERSDRSTRDTSLVRRSGLSIDCRRTGVLPTTENSLGT